MELFTSGWPLLAAAGLFGLIVGSFLNVVILRLPARLMHDWRCQCRELLAEDEAKSGARAAPVDDAPPQPALQADASLVEAAPIVDEAQVAAEPNADAPPPDIVFVGSHCPHCKHALSPLDNIPLVSWLALGGRCRYCKTPISIQYPLVEALTALAAIVVVAQFGFTWQAAAGLVLGFCLIALAGIDFHTQLLPDNITLPLLWIGLGLSTVPLFVDPVGAIMGGALGYLSLWSVYWVFKLATGKEGMGHGDFKLLAALGAWMGPRSLLPIILISSLVGAIVGSIALAARRQDRSTPIPFGPFIAVAGWVQFVWGATLALWYERFLQVG
ncbi:prepilin peptidase [Tahibacter soli]|uniref:Prepilin leader peptidase/N-methyltransferase n=1 Tax=Tahibacter soli TaxID=2983605 RepID=A0A9X4BM05_9GAMM|nr:A24 family peptidase [Tahibacter soli]MDC8015837.1 A24 family peptidase [Tahibacter soli]